MKPASDQCRCASRVLHLFVLMAIFFQQIGSNAVFREIFDGLGIRAAGGSQCHVASMRADFAGQERSLAPVAASHLYGLPGQKRCRLHGVAHGVPWMTQSG